MENNDVGNTVPPAAEVENGSGGSGGHEGVVVANGGEESGFRERRKRGRPRKQLGDIQPEFRTAAAAGDSGGPQKRGRGRPRGSGKWQILAASLGICGVRTNGGSNFTPYIIEIQAGENIVERILSFSNMTCDSICVLSASGTISVAEIFFPASGGRSLRYEGHYTIVCLNGSHTSDDKRSGKGCHLSVQLANSDGRFYGGAVAGSLVAAGPTQIIVSTFRQSMKQQASIKPPNYISAPNPNSENGIVAAAPLQLENGRLPENEAREEGGIFNGTNAL